MLAIVCRARVIQDYCLNLGKQERGLRGEGPGEGLGVGRGRRGGWGWGARREEALGWGSMKCQ